MSQMRETVLTSKKPIFLPTGVVLLPYLYDNGFRRIDLNLGLQPEQQIFSFFGTDGSEYHFDIPKIKEIVERNPELYAVRSFLIRPEDVNYLIAARGVDETHLNRLITDAKLNENGLMIVFPDQTELIIDGNHRMVARYRRQYESMDFTILTIEQAKCALLSLPHEFLPISCD